jgi:hypothetical protein
VGDRSNFIGYQSILITGKGLNISAGEPCTEGIFTKKLVDNTNKLTKKLLFIFLLSE